MAIEDFYEEFGFVEKRKQSDGMGGFINEYVETVPFKAGINTDQSMEARIGEQQGVKSIYTITTSKDCMLEFGDIIKRKRGNSYYKITSNGEDMISPMVSEMDIIQVTAENFTIPIE